MSLFYHPGFMPYLELKPANVLAAEALAARQGLRIEDMPVPGIARPTAPPAVSGEGETVRRVRPIRTLPGALPFLDIRR